MGKIRLPANNWQPRPDQSALWDYMENGGKRGVEVAHRRWGKDEIALHYTATAAHQRVGNYWHLLPQFNQCRKAIWEAVNPLTGKRRIDEAFPQELRENSRETDMMIRFKIGSTWQLVGSDNYNALVGSPPVGIVFSEWALSDPNCWAYLSPILEQNGGWAMFISTPRGHNHLETMLQYALGGNEWFGQLLTVKDTPVFTQKQLDQIREEMIAAHGPVIGESLFNQEYFCSFDAISGACFFAGALEGHNSTISGERGEILKGEIKPNKKGIIEFWRYPYSMVKGWDDLPWVHRYCIGTDISEGLDGDYSVAYVFDRHYREIIARMSSNKIDSYRWAEKVHELAKLYDNALVVPERNGAGITTINRLIELKANLYVKEVIAGIGKQITKQYGFLETKEAKQSLCGNLKAYLSGYVSKPKVYCRTLLNECATFVKDEEKEKLGAEDGFHDDHVIAAALCLVGDEYLPKCEKVQPEPTGWLKRVQDEKKGESVWAR